MSKYMIIMTGTALFTGLVLGLVSASLLRTSGEETPPVSTSQSPTGEPAATLPENDLSPPTLADDATLNPSSEASEKKQPSEVCVSVTGAVRQPGVYCFAPDDRVHDAIEAAGGIREEGDLGDINIAARLQDNTSLYIPFQRYVQQDSAGIIARSSAPASEVNPPFYTRSGWTPETPGPVGTTAPSRGTSTTAPAPPSAPDDGKINLNTATLAELETLPGIGPKTAEMIDAYRKMQPFRSVDELQEVHGIGEKKLEAVRPFVTVE